MIDEAEIDRRISKHVATNLADKWVDGTMVRRRIEGGWVVTFRPRVEFDESGMPRRTASTKLFVDEEDGSIWQTTNSRPMRHSVKLWQDRRSRRAS
jgi:hypothetical protein